MLTGARSLKSVRLWASIADQLAWDELTTAAVLTATAYHQPDRLRELVSATTHGSKARISPSDVMKRAEQLFTRR